MADPELAAAMAMSMQPDNSGVVFEGETGGAAEALANLLSRGDASTEKITTASKTLRKILSNLANEPGNEKFRRLRVGNAQIQAKILCLDGAEAFLMALGFAPSEASEHPAAAFLQIDEAAAAAGAYAGLAALDCLDCSLATQHATRPTGEVALSRELGPHGCEVRAVIGLPGGGVATGATDNLVRLFAAAGLGAYLRERDAQIASALTAGAASRCR